MANLGFFFSNYLLIALANISRTSLALRDTITISSSAPCGNVVRHAESQKLHVRTNHVCAHVPRSYANPAMARCIPTNCTDILSVLTTVHREV